MFLVTASTGFVAGAGLIIAIGAQNAFVLRQGLQRSHVGLVVTTCALGDIALVLCGVAGVGALVQTWPSLLQAFRLGGAVFLVTYGLMAARRAWQGSSALVSRPAKDIGWRRVFLACLAFTFLNPHVYLDTLVLLGGLSMRHTGSARWAFAGGACLASIVWFSALGYGARLLRPVFRDPRAWRVLDTAMAGFMLTLCLLLLLQPLD